MGTMHDYSGVSQMSVLVIMLFIVYLKYLGMEFNSKLSDDTNT